MARKERPTNVDPPKGGEIVVEAVESSDYAGPERTAEEMVSLKRAAERTIRSWGEETAEERAEREKFEREFDAEVELAAEAGDLGRLNEFILRHLVEADALPGEPASPASEDDSPTH